MKTYTKLLVFNILMFILLITSMNLNAQESSWEAGIRFGDNWSVDATIPIGSKPRLHPAVYFDRFGVATYFDWMFGLTDGPTGLKFYVGVGPEVYFGNDVDFSVAGDFGTQYSFNFPMTLGFDWRPGFVITDDMNWKSSNWGLSVRYRFKKGTKLVPAN
jgi:hypothetical protein